MEHGALGWEILYVDCTFGDTGGRPERYFLFDQETLEARRYEMDEGFVVPGKGADAGKKQLPLFCMGHSRTKGLYCKGPQTPRQFSHGWGGYRNAPSGKTPDKSNAYPFMKKG